MLLMLLLLLLLLLPLSTTTPPVRLQVGAVFHASAPRGINSDRICITICHQRRGMGVTRAERRMVRSQITDETRKLVLCAQLYSMPKYFFMTVRVSE
jgi:hypothetical protein